MLFTDRYILIDIFLSFDNNKLKRRTAQLFIGQVGEFLMKYCSFLLLIIVTGFPVATAAEEWGEHPSPPTRTFEITSKIDLKGISSEAERLELWIPLPLESPYQEIQRITIESPHVYSIHREEKHGNRMAYFEISKPAESIEITTRFLVKRIENVQGSHGSSMSEPWEWTLQPANLIPMSPVVREIALNVVDPADPPMERAHALYRHTLSHMSYDKSGEGWGKGDFQYACDIRKGNCTDFHSYFIGLCRNIDIPAYFEIGYSLPRKKAEGEVAGYHCWAYFSDGSRWIPVDISEADKDPKAIDYFFGHHDINRISLSRGRDLTLSPPQKGGPLNYFVFPYAEVDGREHDDIGLIRTFKEPTDM